MGVAVVGVNAWWVTDELEYAIKDSAPKVIFCDAERLARINERPAMAAGSKLVVTRLNEIREGTTAFFDVLQTGGTLPDVAVDRSEEHTSELQSPSVRNL